MADTAKIHIPVINADVPEKPALLVIGVIVVVVIVLLQKKGGSAPASSSGDMTDQAVANDNGIAPAPSMPGGVTTTPISSFQNSTAPKAGSIKNSSDFLKLQTLYDYLAGRETSDSAISKKFIQNKLEGKSRAEISQTEQNLIAKLKAAGASDTDILKARE